MVGKELEKALKEKDKKIIEKEIENQLKEKIDS